MKKLKFVTRFTNAFNKIKGIITGGSDTETENLSKRSVIKRDEMSPKEINFLHNKNIVMKKRITKWRMRNKMRRKTQQQQRF